MVVGGEYVLGRGACPSKPPPHPTASRPLLMPAPVLPWPPQSYHRFMREHLLDHVDLPPGAAHIPDGTVPLAEVPK